MPHAETRGVRRKRKWPAGRIPVRSGIPCFGGGLLWLATVFLSLPVLADDAPHSDTRELISWLLEDGRDLKGIPFSDVLFATTGKRILPVDPVADQAWLGRLGKALDRVLAELNAPSHSIHRAVRINEASRYIEDQLREELNQEEGWKCSIPRTATDEEQRSGYPDLRLTLENGEVVYLDPKLYEDGSRNSTLRTFYFEPKTATSKVHNDARHLLVAIRHNKKTGDDLRLLGWGLVDVSKIRVRLKAEFQASNNDIDLKENVVAEGDGEKSN